MAVSADSAPVANGVHDDSNPTELAFDLPHSPGLRINLHLTVKATSILLFLTSTNADSSQSAASMGSFVYAMPDVCFPSAKSNVAFMSNDAGTEVPAQSTNEYCSIQRAILSRLHDQNREASGAAPAEAVLRGQQCQPFRCHGRR